MKYTFVLVSNYETLLVDIPSIDVDYMELEFVKKFLTIPHVKCFGIIRKYIHCHDKANHSTKVIYL